MKQRIGNQDNWDISRKYSDFLQKVEPLKKVKPVSAKFYIA